MTTFDNLEPLASVRGKINAAIVKVDKGDIGLSTVAALLADTSGSRGEGATWQAGGFRYKEVFSGEHITTAGGVKLYVLPGADGSLSLDQFGIIKDGTGDQSSAIKAAIAVANGRLLKCGAGVYRVTSVIDHIGSVNLDFSRSRFVADGNARVFDFKANAFGPYYLTANYTAGTTSLSVDALPSAPKSGQVFWIVSQATDLGNRDRGSLAAKYRTGEAFRATTGSTTTTINLVSPLVHWQGGDPVSAAGDEAIVDAYTTAYAAHVSFPDMSAQCNVLLPEIEYPDGQGTDWKSNAVVFTGYVDGYCRGGRILRGYRAGIDVAGTFGFTVETPFIQNLSDNGSVGQFGYGVGDGGWQTRVIGMTAHNTRHGFSTTVGSSDWSSITAYTAMSLGRRAGSQIIGGTVSGGVNSLFDTHAESEDVSFIGNFAENGGGIAYGFACRGRNINIITPTVRNCYGGALVFTEFQSGDPDDDLYNNGKRLQDFTSAQITSPRFTVRGTPMDARAATLSLGGNGVYRTQASSCLLNVGGTIVLDGTHTFTVEGDDTPDLAAALIDIRSSNVSSAAAFPNPTILINGNVTINASGWTGGAITAIKTEAGTRLIVAGILRMILPTGTTLFDGGVDQVLCRGEGRIQYSIGSSTTIVSPGTREVHLFEINSGDIIDNLSRIGTIPTRSGSGSPEGVLTAPVGSLYLRTDGGAGTCLYIKESGTGNTGWVAK